MVDMRNAYKLLVGKPEGKRPFGRPRHKWMYNIRVDLREVGWEVVDWIHLSTLEYGPVAGSCERGNEPSGSIKGGKFFHYLSDC
jgi:hypothetical protein